MPKIYSNNPFYPEETGAFRHELKLLCSAQDLAIVRARLKNLLPFDTHAGENGQYTIRSLYFDDYNDSCLRENEAGVDNRRKYRIRLYNGSPDRLQLEIKRKRHGMTQKLSCRLTREQCETLMRGRCPPYLPARWTPACGRSTGVCPTPGHGRNGGRPRRPWPPPRRNGRPPGNRRPSGSFASR